MRAISLFSGGLDSMIAIKLMRDQGLDVTALHIKIGFSGTKDLSTLMQKRAELAGADFRIIDVRESYIQDILFSPVYGYGKNFNPCIDCHGYMFKIAKAMMKELDASFLVTGEVLGQRPMSQRSDALKQVSKLANDKEDRLILRPLSAKLMEPTTPEREGWVSREELLDISGRSRERQLAMAKAWGWEDYESPGGGCLLTEPVYSQKIREFITHDTFEVADIDLLKFGRHFRLPQETKLIVGRNKEDNDALQALEHPAYFPIELPVLGPYSLLHRDAGESDILLALKITLTYGKSSANEIYTVSYKGVTYEVQPFETKSEAQRYFFDAEKQDE